MNIVSKLKTFDGTHTGVLEELAEAVFGDENAIEILLAASESDEERLQTAATWVLKRLQEDGISFSTQQANRILGLLPNVVSWQAKLQLLQLVPQLQIPKRRVKSLYTTLIADLESEGNKFLRAWSYNGLFVIADQHPSFRKEVAQLLVAAQQEEAASVKARIRNLLKSSDWL